MNRLRSGNAARSRSEMSRYASCSSVVAPMVTPAPRFASSRRAMRCSSSYKAVNNWSAAAWSPCSAEATSVESAGFTDGLDRAGGRERKATTGTGDLAVGIWTASPIANSEFRVPDSWVGIERVRTVRTSAPLRREPGEACWPRDPEIVRNSLQDRATLFCEAQRSVLILRHCDEPGCDRCLNPAATRVRRFVTQRTHCPSLRQRRRQVADVAGQHGDDAVPPVARTSVRNATQDRANELTLVGVDGARTAVAARRTAVADGKVA